MKILKNLFISILSAFNYPYISRELLDEIKGPVLLHISDTPVDVYPYIFKIIDVINPQYIVHTGDMADNVKLGIHKYKTDIYSKGVAKLISGMEKNEGSRIYYVLGNHDDHEIVSNMTKRGIILNEGILDIDDCSIFVSHYFKENLKDVDFYLYGHSFEPGHHRSGSTVGLNGVLNINIIDLSNKRVFHLDYPSGTDASRGMKLRRIGL